MELKCIRVPSYRTKVNVKVTSLANVLLSSAKLFTFGEDHHQRKVSRLQSRSLNDNRP